jgi:hypothetical protein
MTADSRAYTDCTELPKRTMKSGTWYQLLGYLQLGKRVSTTCTPGLAEGDLVGLQGSPAIMSEAKRRRLLFTGRLRWGWSGDDHEKARAILAQDARALRRGRS